jgi:endonuclease YncB( thermonuclease family)
MHPTDAGPPRPKKRIPKWLAITLAVFGVLFVLGAIFGKAPDKTVPLAATPQPSPTSATTTSASPVAVTYTVASVTNGATLEVTGSDGTRKTVRVFGVIAPLAGSGCYATETLAWATTELIGKAVALGTETAQGVTVTITGGGDYATEALENGYVKYATAAGSLALQALESTARTAAKGLWGAPCNGTIDAPAPAPPAPVQPVAPSVTKAAPPPPVRTTEEQPAPEPAPDVYYKNCTDAKAHGATNIHRGEPGYGRELDRDNDGVACES